MTDIMFWVFVACGTVTVQSEPVREPEAPLAQAMAAPPGCPYWYMAPCGEDFDHRFVCEPCREQVYACSTGGDPRLNRWGVSGWPCECIDPKTGELMDWKPECTATTD